MSEKKFELGNYVEVKDRIAILYELYPQARLVTGEIRVSNEPDGKPRVLVQAFAYRTPDDPLPGIGWSWMELPGSTPYTRGSELENTETSAWGRAIASLGILIDRSIASAQEVANKEGDQPVRVVQLPPNATPEQVERMRPELERRADGLIGTVSKGASPADLELRRDPDGTAFWGFKMKNGRIGYQAFAVGPLAESLALANSVDSIEGQSVEVWGRVEMVAWRKGDREMPPYARIQIERVKGPEWTLPADEAETVPLFNDVA